MVALCIFRLLTLKDTVMKYFLDDYAGVAAIKI